MKIFKSLILIVALLCFISVTNSQSTNKIKISKLPPKFILGGTVGYNFVVGSANGEVTNFSLKHVENSDNMIFNPPNYGMEQGGAVTLFGKQSINRKRNLYMTGELGYNLFYNTMQQGVYRTKWSIFNLGTGIEFRNRSTSRNIVFVGMQLQYSLIFGGWQSNITYPDNTVSNIYVKVKPASRLGLSLSSGMEFRANKKSYIVVGLRGTWANLFPKNTESAVPGYETTINDSEAVIGSQATNYKDIIFLQLFTGLNFSIK